VIQLYFCRSHIWLRHVDLVDRPALIKGGARRGVRRGVRRAGRRGGRNVVRRQEVVTIVAQ
jgi:hypothetical protein